MALTMVADRKPKKFTYQYDTSNLSFIKMWQLLENKEIENNLFFLKLYDKRLRKVDPYDPDLTEDEQIAVFNECKINKWYFIREVFRLPINGAAIKIGGGEPFQLHRGNLAQLWACELNLNTMSVAPRQSSLNWSPNRKRLVYKLRELRGRITSIY